MPTGKEEYISALHLGQKEKKKREAEGLDPRPRVLDEELPEALQAQTVDLPPQEIPAELIVGTKSRGRMNVFSASFYPLAAEGSEFAAKWAALCEAHLSQTGIREAIECYEYLGEFFVAEGNKRVSVLRYFGAVRIPARIRRILPTRSPTAMSGRASTPACWLRSAKSPAKTGRRRRKNVSFRFSVDIKRLLPRSAARSRPSAPRRRCCSF